MLRSKKKPDPVEARIVVLGEDGVGKTCFCDMFSLGRTFVYYDPTNESSSRRIMDIDGTSWFFELIDINSSVYDQGTQVLHSPFYEHVLYQADGLLLLYDVTSKESFDKVTNEAYLRTWATRNSVFGGLEKTRMERKGLGCVLVGNKIDLLKPDKEKREVDQELAEQWAESQGFRHTEIRIDNRKQVEHAIELLAQNIKKLKARAETRVAEERETEKKRQKEQKEHRRSSLAIAMKKILPIHSKRTDTTDQ